MLICQINHLKFILLSYEQPHNVAGDFMLIVKGIFLDSESIFVQQSRVKIGVVHYRNPVHHKIIPANLVGSFM